MTNVYTQVIRNPTDLVYSRICFGTNNALCDDIDIALCATHPRMILIAEIRNNVRRGIYEN